MSKRYVAFSGGGVRSIALIGVLKFLKLSGIEVSGFSGTSAGSVLAALAANGWTYEQIRDFVIDTNFSKYIKFDTVGFLGNFGKPKGLMDNTKYGKLFDDLQAQGKLVPKDNLWINAVRTDTRQEVVFNGQAFADYGYGDILRASSAIPAVIKPVTIDSHEFMDGGCAQNPYIPENLGPGDEVWIFHCGYASNKEVPHNWIQSITNTIDSLSYYRDKFRFNDSPQLKLIVIPVMDVRSTDFGISRKQKLALVDYGFQACIDALV